MGLQLVISRDWPGHRFEVWRHYGPGVTPLLCDVGYAFTLWGLIRKVDRSPWAGACRAL